MEKIRYFKIKLNLNNIFFYKSTPTEDTRKNSTKEGQPMKTQEIYNLKPANSKRREKHTYLNTLPALPPTAQ